MRSPPLINFAVRRQLELDPDSYLACDVSQWMNSLIANCGNVEVRTHTGVLLIPAVAGLGGMVLKCRHAQKTFRVWTLTGTRGAP